MWEERDQPKTCFDFESYWSKPQFSEREKNNLLIETLVKSHLPWGSVLSGPHFSQRRFDCSLVLESSSYFYLIERDFVVATWIWILCRGVIQENKNPVNPRIFWGFPAIMGHLLHRKDRRRLVLAGAHNLQLSLTWKDPDLERMESCSKIQWFQWLWGCILCVQDHFHSVFFFFL